MKNILLIGGGGHCKSVIDVIEQEAKFSIAGIIDKKERVGEKVFDYNIIGSDKDLEEMVSRYSYAIVSVGHVKSNDARVNIYKRLKELGFKTPTIISPLAYVSKHAKVGGGTVVMHHAVINAGATVGENCIINTKALIEHDCIVEDNCHLSTSAVLNGGVKLKKNSFFGSNATSRETSIQSGFIKAGSVAK